MSSLTTTYHTGSGVHRFLLGGNQIEKGTEPQWAGLKLLLQYGIKAKAYLVWCHEGKPWAPVVPLDSLAPHPSSSCAHHCTRYTYCMCQSCFFSVRLCFSLYHLSTYSFVFSRGQAEALLCWLLPPASVHSHVVYQPLPGPLHHLYHLHQRVYYEHWALQSTTGSVSAHFNSDLEVLFIYRKAITAHKVCCLWVMVKNSSLCLCLVSRGGSEVL